MIHALFLLFECYDVSVPTTLKSISCCDARVFSSQSHSTKMLLFLQSLFMCRANTFNTNMFICYHRFFSG